MPKFNFKKIESMEWYQQGAAAYPFYIANPYRCGRVFYPTFVHNKGYLNTGYFNKAKEGRLARYYLRKLGREPAFLKKRIAKWCKIVRQQMQLLKIVEQPEFKLLSNNKLARFMASLDKIGLKYWSTVCLIEYYDPWGNAIINEELAKFPNINLTAGEIRTLTAPFKLDYLNEEQLDRFNLVKQVKKSARLRSALNKIKTKNDFKNREIPDSFYKRLKRHTKKYFWLENTWAGSTVLHEDFFIRRIKQDLSNFKRVKKQVAVIKNYPQEILRKKRVIKKRYKLPFAIVQLFDYISHLTDWRNLRKRYVLIYIHYLDQILNELASRNKVDWKILRFALFTEIKSWRLSKSYIKELKLRSKECLGYIGADGKFKWQSNKIIKKVLTAIAKSYKVKTGQLTGTPICHGRARGKVRIIETRQEFRKMKKGDVLVAKMTRPEFLPVIKLASAIITDEGGLTCHAAIIAREFNIPCLVGTQMATNVFKDGDKVVIDANKGIVWKIN